MFKIWEGDYYLLSQVVTWLKGSGYDKNYLELINLTLQMATMLATFVGNSYLKSYGVRWLKAWIYLKRTTVHITT